MAQAEDIVKDSHVSYIHNPKDLSFKKLDFIHTNSGHLNLKLTAFQADLNVRVDLRRKMPIRNSKQVPNLLIDRPHKRCSLQDIKVPEVQR